MRAEILSYSRSRGLFAGISLEGSTLRPDNKANARIYGRKITARAILLGNKVAIPATARHFVRVLQTNAPRNESKQVASHEVRRSSECYMRPASRVIGSLRPLRPRRFRRSPRSLPSAVPHALSRMGSSSRELHAPSETPVLTRPAPLDEGLLPWGLPSLFTTSAGGIVTTGSRPRRLPSSAFLTPPRACSASGLAGLFRPAAAYRVLPREAPTRTGGAPRRRAVALSSLMPEPLPPVSRRRHSRAPRPQGVAPCESSGAALRCLAAARSSPS
jgi:hypothetical protein